LFSLSFFFFFFVPFLRCLDKTEATTSQSTSLFCSRIARCVETSRKSHTGAFPELRDMRKRKEEEGKKKRRRRERKRERERAVKYCTQSYTGIPGGSAVSPASATSLSLPLRFISMVSDSSGKDGILVVRGNANKKHPKKRQVFQEISSRLIFYNAASSADGPRCRKKKKKKEKAVSHVAMTTGDREFSLSLSRRYFFSVFVYPV